MHLNLKIAWTLLFLTYFFAEITAQIQLSEIVTKNASSLTINNENPDWIELYNPSETAINLEGYYLSDDPDEPDKWRFPNYEIAEKSYLIVLADGRNIKDDFLHTNFKLAADGETLVLSNADLEELEKVTIPPLETDVSYAKVNNIWFPTIPTPFKANQAITIEQLTPPVFNEQSKIFNTPFELKITHQEEAVKLDYWINDLANKQMADNGIIDISLDSTIIICAKATKKGYLSSDVKCYTFIYKQDHALPILSVIGDQAAFFDEEEGLFQLGPNASSNWPFLGANFWEDEDTEVYFQYFNVSVDSLFYGHGDLEMHGGRESRTNPQKTFRLLAKNKYDQPFFNHSFFPIQPEITEYKRLVVRNASGDYNAGHCRDGFLQNYLVSAGLDLDANSYQPIAVYINGKYYGMMGLREKMDRYYTKSNYETVDIDLLENNRELITGDTQVFQQQYSYLLENDLSDPIKFKQATSYFDTQNLTDYFIAQIGNVSTAWPQNNIKYWRDNTSDGKWRFLLYDMDISLARHKWTLASENALLNKMTAFDGQNIFINIVNAFLENPDFKTYFLNRHQDLFNTVLSSDQMLPAFQEFIKEITSEIALQLDRWPTNTFENWQTKEQGKIIEFIENRALFSMQHYDEYFQLGGIYELTLKGDNNDLVSFDLNSLTQLSTGFQGKYFKKVPITISAKEMNDKHFTYWEIKQGNEVVRAYENPLRKAFDTDTELRPIFKENSLVFGATIFNIVGNKLTVNITSLNTTAIHLKVVDLLGRTIYENQLTQVNVGNNIVEIPILPLQQGMLLLNVQQDEKNQTIKFFKPF